MTHLFRFLAPASLLTTASIPLLADVSVPKLFGDHMIFQRDVPTRVWGTADRGENITVSLAGKQAKTSADENGKWSVTLAATSHKPGENHELVIKGNNTIAFSDILFGEVWLCSGQSNMEWPLLLSRDWDLPVSIPQSDQIRLLKIQRASAQEPLEDINPKSKETKWGKASNSAQIKHFSAVGFHFGKMLEEALDVPVGLIQCAWGGSPAEAWINRDLLEEADFFQDTLNWWKSIEVHKTDEAAAEAKLQMDMEAWKTRAAEAESVGKPVPPKPKRSGNLMTGQHRPANLYNGMIKPIVGFPIRGTIWYQGESNTQKADEYGKLFPLLINSWRKEWDIGDFSFYWVNLAGFKKWNPEPLQQSDWAELRAAQTATLSLPNTGEALAIDLGEEADIHPRNKRDVAARLARIALAKDYGFSITYQNPKLDNAQFESGKIILNFKDVGSELRSLGSNNILGFSVAGKDGKHHWAKGKITANNTIELTCEQVKEPKEIRYAWAEYPKANVYNKELLPLTPFRIKL